MDNMVATGVSFAWGLYHNAALCLYVWWVLGGGSSRINSKPSLTMHLSWGLCDALLLWQRCSLWPIPCDRVPCCVCSAVYACCVPPGCCMPLLCMALLMAHPLCRAPAVKGQGSDAVCMCDFCGAFMRHPVMCHACWAPVIVAAARPCTGRTWHIPCVMPCCVGQGRDAVCLCDFSVACIHAAASEACRSCEMLAACKPLSGSCCWLCVVHCICAQVGQLGAARLLLSHTITQCVTLAGLYVSQAAWAVSLS